MTPTEDLLPGGEKMRKALRWVSETLAASTDKTRQQVFREAETRFDLSPRECEFLDKKICAQQQEEK